MEVAEHIVKLISNAVLPVVVVVAVIGIGAIIYRAWVRVTKKVKPPVLSDTNITLMTLIDHIRLLDNDLIRLTNKVNYILSVREQELNRHKTDDDIRSHTLPVIEDADTHEDSPKR